MNTKRIQFVLCLLGGLLLVTCSQEAPKVPPLSIDLPVSFKSDSAVYYFVMNQNDVWNAFGKKVESMYRKGEKFKQKEFSALSQRELLKMLNLERDYLVLWMTQDLYLSKMSLDASLILDSASDQGAAKVIETQRLIMNYYQQLAKTFGTGLYLDQEPYKFTPEEDSLHEARLDSLFGKRTDSVGVNQSEIDSLLRMLISEQPNVK